MIQLKIKLFIWMAAYDKILTWEALQRKGWEGPGVCKLCKCNSESTNHLLVHCPFIKVVWLRLYKICHLKIQWVGTTVSDCFNEWTKEKSTSASLAAIACWHIWIERNKSLFEELTPSHISVFHRISVTFFWQPTIFNPIPNRFCDITQTEGYTLACFDRTSLSTGECCATSGFFKNHASRITKWYINCGAGTNTKAKLMGLWATVTLATIWAIEKIQIPGDSKVIIDWINQKGQLHAVNIESWKIKTKELTRNFKDISYQHIYREHNKEVNLLSKRALKEPKGRLSVYHWDNGEKIPLTHLNIFEA
jgi:ribonuclease HI